MSRPDHPVETGDRGDRITFSDQLLMAAMAQRYYREHKTRIEIAEEFQLSRFKVSRMLEAALSAGLVKITIELPAAVDADLSLRMKARFGLRRALVVSAPDRRPVVVRDALGRAAAALVSELVADDDVLGVTSGRTVDAVASHLERLAGCDIVQLTGMSGSLADNPVEVLRRVAMVSGGRAYTIFAPLTVATAEAADALKTDPRIADALARFSSVTVAVTAIGSWQPPESRYFDALSPGDQRSLVRQGVFADIGGALLDQDGAVVSDFDDRVLGVSAEQLGAIDEVVMVGGGVRKVGAVLAALRSGIVTSLVTDDSVAVPLLAGANG